VGANLLNQPDCTLNDIRYPAHTPVRRSPPRPIV
jgi:hypothetical protein